MNTLLQNRHVRQTLNTLYCWAPLWIGCTLLCSGTGTYYALFMKKDRWQASQALLVRDEASGSQIRQGRFESSTQLKVAQELILDLVRNPQVIRSALVEVGPGQNEEIKGEFPNAEYLRRFSESSLTMRAPRGAELGSTEILYLDVKDESPDRALQLAKAMTDSLEKQLRNVRETRAQSMTEELAQARETARNQLAATTKRLQEVEAEAGSDLPDLRSMVENSGSFNPRSSVEQMQSELRQAANRHEQSLIEEQMLAAAAADPLSFINAPGNLINSQPGLKRLREGLVDAQLVRSQLVGKFTEDHPAVEAARVAESQIIERLNMELQAALVNIKREITASEALQQRLREQIANTEKRIDHLANIRAAYANIVAEVRTRSSILEAAERELAEADASRIASQSISLVTRVDKPMVGDKPIGPGKSIVILGSLVGGLVCGFGFTFLISPLTAGSGYGRRASDNEGRRPGDRRGLTERAIGPHVSEAPRPLNVPGMSNGNPATASQTPVVYDGAQILRDLLAANPELVTHSLRQTAETNPSSPTSSPMVGEGGARSSDASSVIKAVERRTNPRKNSQVSPVIAVGVRDPQSMAALPTSNSPS